MLEKTHFLNLRGTEFIDKLVPYKNETIKAMLQLFPDYTPSLLQQVPAGIIISIEQQPWKLISQDQSCVIVFNSNKIDIIRTVGTEFGMEEVSRFTEFCSSSFRRINNELFATVKRLAFAPKYAIKKTDFCLPDFTKTVFSKNQFEGSQIDSCNFNAVFRVNKIIGNQPSVLVNFLAQFEEGSFLESTKGKPETIVPCLCFSFDINTYPLDTIIFSDKDIEDFFKKSITWNEDIANYYFNK